MKLRELLELQDRPETNTVITILEGENCHMFMSELDYKYFDLDTFGDAEVLHFRAKDVYGLPYSSITCQLQEKGKDQ